MRLLAAALLLVSLASAEELFNGKNLEGWYTYLRDSKYEDPKHVFSVQDGMIRISGEEWGGVTTKRTFENFRLIVEWKWGGKTWGNRETKARDSGILVRAVGDDGLAGGNWLESIESQIIEGGSGDFILVAGKSQPTATAEVQTIGKQIYWKEGSPAQKVSKGRINWYGRDPEWQDAINFRGTTVIEKPVGEWNRQEVICDGSTITNVLNGTVMAKITDVSLTSGKIQIQSEGAEILVRRVTLQPLNRESRIEKRE